MTRSTRAVYLLLFAAAPLVSSCRSVPFPSAGGLPFNFHIVDEGRLFRSAEPSADELKAVIDTYFIRTVVNLRGSHPGEPWYDSDAEVCRQNGVKLVDHAMSARSLPTRELLSGVINTLKTAEYPMLIHCQGGADRTGAVCAIYRQLILGEDKETASAELSPEFLHFTAFTPCMDTLAEIFQPAPAWLDEYAATVEQIDCKQ